MTRAPDAVLVLEDGSAFRGRSLGATGETFGEAVFNTGMSGYQEVLTDPSYARQIVAMTAPEQGNYGTNDEDPESIRVQVAGFAVREASYRPSSWRNRRSLPELLLDSGVVGIEGIDTRRLTLRLREAGAMRAAISTEDLDATSLHARIIASPGMSGADLARDVGAARPWEARELVGPASERHGRILRVAAWDFGMKRTILRLLADAGCETTVLPPDTPAEAALDGTFDGTFDGAFLGNGPGDPAATRYGIDAAAGLLGRIPVFGICLGHQLLGHALGGRTYKMRFGHRGSNQPVRDLDTGRIEITSHNHGFAVDPDGWGPILREDDRAPIVETPHGRVALTHWNLNDGTLEGLRALDVPASSVQYHPEAAPGPHDAAHLFDAFRRAMGV